MVICFRYLKPFMQCLYIFGFTNLLEFSRCQVPYSTYQLVSNACIPSEGKLLSNLRITDSYSLRWQMPMLLFVFFALWVLTLWHGDKVHNIHTWSLNYTLMLIPNPHQSKGQVQRTNQGIRFSTSIIIGVVEIYPYKVIANSY